MKAEEARMRKVSLTRLLGLALREPKMREAVAGPCGGHLESRRLAAMHERVVDRRLMLQDRRRISSNLAGSFDPTR